MLTIKHITPMGNETLYETPEVSYSAHPKPIDRGLDFGPLTGSLWYTSVLTGQMVELRDGMIFVMNGNGSTVAKYDLGGWAGPQATAA